MEHDVVRCVNGLSLVVVFYVTNMSGNCQENIMAEQETTAEEQKEQCDISDGD